MKENKYDNEEFFRQYSQMNRSVHGLSGAGEWHVLKEMLPGFAGKRVLDLGCGFGWHCKYAVEHDAAYALGIDLSQNMINVANEINSHPRIEYLCMAIEDYEYPAENFDIVISSLAFHYLESFDDICEKIKKCLTPNGQFVFSVEHPVFTAYGSQEWFYDENGNKLHWPVDRYFFEGRRTANFLGEDVTKYHKTLTSYINTLLKKGFAISGLEEPKPEEKWLETIPEMKDELRRPMMLIISAEKL